MPLPWHYSTATARARDLFCSRVRATAFRRASWAFSQSPAARKMFFRDGFGARRGQKTFKKVKIVVGSYCSAVKFYCFSYCPLGKSFKDFDIIGRSRSTGVVRLAPTAPIVPCHMVRNDIFFTNKFVTLWNGC